ncbi:hypothetical protein DNG35_09645 [Mesonia sp. K7]|nr:hypothetical protein DNG35_09645 [Mesonia sp. K7]
MFGLPIIFQIFIMTSMFADVDANGNPNPETFFNFFKLFPIIMFLYTGLFYGWFWSIANGLQKFIPAENRLKLKKFRIFFFIPLIYILFFVVIIGTTFYGISTGDNAVGGIVGKMLFVILPLHLFSMFCMFYQLYFTSKTIKTAELKRKVTFSDHMGEFFMIWFFPIGIWVIQPKINRIVNGENTTDKNV